MKKINYLPECGEGIRRALHVLSGKTDGDNLRIMSFVKGLHQQPNENFK